jgi:acyl-coenzyme A thioesterase PaaI-like protein
VTSHLKNRLGAFHGGAAASAIEEACGLYLTEFKAKEQSKVSSKLFVEKIEVRYLSPMKGEVEVHVSETQAPFHSNEVLLAGTIVSVKSQQVCVEFSCSCTQG